MWDRRRAGSHKRSQHPYSLSRDAGSDGVLPRQQIPGLWGEGEQVLKGLAGEVSVDCNGYRNDE